MEVNPPISSKRKPTAREILEKIKEEAEKDIKEGQISDKMKGLENLREKLRENKQINNDLKQEFEEIRAEINDNQLEKPIVLEIPEMPRTKSKEIHKEASEYIRNYKKSKENLEFEKKDEEEKKDEGELSFSQKHLAMAEEEKPKPSKGDLHIQKENLKTKSENFDTMVLAFNEDREVYSDFSIRSPQTIAKDTPLFKKTHPETKMSNEGRAENGLNDHIKDHAKEKSRSQSEIGKETNGKITYTQENGGQKHIEQNKNDNNGEGIHNNNKSNDLKQEIMEGNVENKKGNLNKGEFNIMDFKRDSQSQPGFGFKKTNEPNFEEKINHEEQTIDYKNLDYSKIDYNKLDYSKLHYHKFDYQKLDYKNLDYKRLDYMKLDYQSLDYNRLVYTDLDYNKLEYRDLDYNQLDYQKLDYNQLNYEKFDYNRIDFESFDPKKLDSERKPCISRMNPNQNQHQSSSSYNESKRLYDLQTSTLLSEKLEKANHSLQEQERLISWLESKLRQMEEEQNCMGRKIEELQEENDSLLKMNFELTKEKTNLKTNIEALKREKETTNSPMTTQNSTQASHFYKEKPQQESLTNSFRGLKKREEKDEFVIKLGELLRIPNGSKENILKEIENLGVLKGFSKEIENSPIFYGTALRQKLDKIEAFFRLFELKSSGDFFSNINALYNEFYIFQQFLKEVKEVMDLEDLTDIALVLKRVVSKVKGTNYGSRHY